MTWQDKVLESDPRKCMWEILVPTEKRIKSPRPGVRAGYGGGGGGGDFADVLEAWQRRNSYSTRYHRVWDEKVREITGGLTILTPAKGQWISPSGELHAERMIPVRMIATRDQINTIIDMTLEYYDQLAVLCYKLSDEVILKHKTAS